jgi:hypothetical protein
MAQVVEHLPGKHEVLRSKPSTTRKKGQGKGKEKAKDKNRTDRKGKEGKEGREKNKDCGQLGL